MRRVRLMLSCSCVARAWALRAQSGQRTWYVRGAPAGNEGKVSAQKLERVQLGALEQCEHRHRHRQQEQRDATKGERSCSRPEHRLHHVQLRERRLRIACDARAEAVAAAAALDAASQPRKRLRVSQTFFVPRTLSFAALAEARLAQLLLLASRISESVIGAWLNQSLLPPCNLLSHGVYNSKARTERFTQPRT
jgi:hypothetical protein